MSILHAVILGLVEGLTEFLPISSTGHLILAAALLGFDDDPVRKASVDTFMIVVQGGAILAVLGVFRQRVRSMIDGLRGRDPAGRRLALNLLVAFLPAAVTGPLLADLIERHLFRAGPVIAALALGGLAMILITPWQRARFGPEEFDEDAPGQGDGEDERAGAYVDLDELRWTQALVIGVLQCVAMWPGTSRSMTTIVGGMMVGLRPRQAAEFSFLLGLPTLGGACVYKLAGDLSSDGASMFQVLGVAPLLVGFAVATVSAALAVHWLVSYLARHGLALFGWYRIALCVVLLALVALGAIEIGVT